MFIHSVILLSLFVHAIASSAIVSPYSNIIYLCYYNSITLLTLLTHTVKLFTLLACIITFFHDVSLYSNILNIFLVDTVAPSTVVSPDSDIIHYCYFNTIILSTLLTYTVKLFLLFVHTITFSTLLAHSVTVFIILNSIQ